MATKLLLMMLTLQPKRSLCDWRRREDERPGSEEEVSNSTRPRSAQPSRLVLWAGEISTSATRREEVDRWVLEVREGPGRRVNSTGIVSFLRQEVEEEEGKMDEAVEPVVEEGKPLDVDERKRRLVDRTSKRRSCVRLISFEQTRGRGGFPKLLREVVEEERELELGLEEEVEEGMDPVLEVLK